MAEKEEKEAKEKDIESRYEILLGKEKAIRLIGFNNLDPSELSIVKKIAGHYVQKIENILHEYDEVKVKLKIHERSKLFFHEIEAEIFSGGKRFSARSEHKNIFHALSECFEGMLREITREYKDREYDRKSVSKAELGVDIKELKKEKI
ncbi:MAG: hypothetical protein QXJ92_00955 [Candidatus Pacearchaeota archaeon]